MACAQGTLSPYFQAARLSPISQFTRAARRNRWQSVITRAGESGDWLQRVHLIEHSFRRFHASTLEIGIFQINHGMEPLIAGFSIGGSQLIFGGQFSRFPV